jgi:hypothetical protein
MTFVFLFDSNAFCCLKHNDYAYELSSSGEGAT